MEALIGMSIIIIAFSAFAIIVGNKNARPALYKDEDTDGRF